MSVEVIRQKNLSFFIMRPTLFIQFYFALIFHRFTLYLPFHQIKDLRLLNHSKIVNLSLLAQIRDSLSDQDVSYLIEKQNLELFWVKFRLKMPAPIPIGACRVVCNLYLQEFPR